MPNQQRHHAYVSFWTMLCLALLLPMMAFAQATGATTAKSNAMADVLCTVGGWLWGPLGQVLGVLAVICLGLAAMFGKIQVTTVLTTMAGIAIMLGAPTITKGLFTNLEVCTKSDDAMILNSEMYDAFVCIISWFTGAVGKSLATLAVIVLGIFALYGKISYHQGLIVASGIAAMFGATTIIAGLGLASPGSVAKAGCNSGNLEMVYCSVINWFNGPLGKGMATVGIIIIGLGALYGKVSWGLAIICAVGVALIFGGTTIVNALGADGSQSCNAAGNSQNLALSIMFCNVVNWFNGPIGKGVATLAVIIVGLGALFGKISWTSSLLVAVGVALIFGGTTMVNALGGPGNMACATGNMNPASNSTGTNGNTGTGTNGGSQSSRSSISVSSLPGASSGGVVSGSSSSISIPGPNTGNSSSKSSNGVSNSGSVSVNTPFGKITLNLPERGQDGSITLPGGMGTIRIPGTAIPGQPISLGKVNIAGKQVDASITLPGATQTGGVYVNTPLGKVKIATIPAGNTAIPGG